MVLREYQTRTINMIKQKMQEGCKRIIVTLPTGAGKSIIMGHIAKMCVDKGNKALALMHRRGLVDQLGDRFRSCGVDSGVIMSGIESDLEKPVQIGTIQTYSRRLEFEQTNVDTGLPYKPWQHDAGVVFVDEAHRSLSKTFQSVLRADNVKTVLGFTATPSLSTGAAMGLYYDSLIQPVSVRELIQCGSLVSGLYYGLSTPELADLKIVNGDYEQVELGRRVNAPKLVGDIVANWNELASGKRTLCFAVNVKHSKAIVNEFLRYGVTAEHLDARSDDEKRAETIARFRSGETKILSNVGLYTEGTDIPEIECICLARPTNSFALYLQMVGRGARPSIGKRNFIVLDHGANVNFHGFYEDDIEWTLDGKKISCRKISPREIKEKHKMTCKVCNAIFTGPMCPACLTEIPDYGKQIEAVEAKLQALQQKKEDGNKPNRFKSMSAPILIGMLRAEAERLDKSDSWIRANYRNLTGKWPQSLDHAKIRPTTELLDYLTYLRIKWIKSQKRKAA
jgi:superfamily II DNA or RNA helicase